MRVSSNFFDLIKPFFLRIFAIVFLLGSLNFATLPDPVFAEGTECHTSGPISGAYIVTVCLTAPLDNAVVSGDTSVTATVSVTGTNPGVQKLIFYLGGEYLLTD